MCRVVQVKSGIAALALAFTLLLVAQARAGGSQLVILESRAHPVPQGLVEALRIQLAGTADVSEVTVPSASVRRSDAELERRSVAWVLWVEESGAETGVSVVGGGEPITLSPAPIPRPSTREPAFGRGKALNRSLDRRLAQAGSISTAGHHHFMSGALYTSSFDTSTGAFGAPSALLSPQGTQNFYYPSFSPIAPS